VEEVEEEEELCKCWLNFILWKLYKKTMNVGNTIERK
jgi:hypothetical protein